MERFSLAHSAGCESACKTDPLRWVPHEPYVYADVDIGHHYYSVPHQLMRHRLKLTLLFC